MAQVMFGANFQLAIITDLDIFFLKLEQKTLSITIETFTNF